MQEGEGGQKRDISRVQRGEVGEELLEGEDVERRRQKRR